MSATTEQLKARWETKDGERRLAMVVASAKRGKAWHDVLRGFPFVEEVVDGRDLRDANLHMVYLTGADLTDASLRGSNLTEADLTVANLIGADLGRATLVDAHLGRACMQNANLSEACLIGVDLRDADLSGANLRAANLRAANLIDARLIGAALEDADLRRSSLVQAVLDGAVLSGAKLFASARDDWSIKGIKCDCLYWDKAGKERTPEDRDFVLGEFERIYASLPTIEYVFRNGMTPLDPLIMDRVVQSIRERLPEFDIRMDSINARGLAPTIKFTVQHQEQKDAALAEVKAEYENRIKLVEGERDRLLAAIVQGLAAPRQFINKNIGSGSVNIEGDAVINVQVQEATRHVAELQKAIQDAPDESIPQAVKKTGMYLLFKTLEDVAKADLKEAAKQVWELGKTVGPLVTQTAAYHFFKGLLGQ